MLYSYTGFCTSFLKQCVLKYDFSLFYELKDFNALVTSPFSLILNHKFCKKLKNNFRFYISNEKVLIFLLLFLQKNLCFFNILKKK